MVRAGCCSDEGVKRGAWTSHEDKLLSEYIAAHGLGRWRSLPKNAGLNRCPKSCRLRWLNYLRPGIKRGNITPDEEELIVRLHNLLGNRWSLIAGRLPGRTDNEIKNYWNTSLRKRAAKQGRENPTQGDRRRPPCPGRGDEREYSERNAAADAAISTRVIRTKAHRCTRFISQNQFSGAQLPASPPPLEFEIDSFFYPNSPPSPNDDYYFFSGSAGDDGAAITDGFLIEEDAEGEELLQFLSSDPMAH